MGDLHVADISEYQTSVDFSKVGPAIFMRAFNGARADSTFASRLPLARKYTKVRILYVYLKADLDAATQASQAAAVIGRLQPGEAVAVDLEEGAGDQAARFTAAYQILKTKCGGLVGEYSGRSFYTDHLIHSKPDFLWLAAYGSNEPSIAHALWQHTDHELHPGISTACDCSIFHGSVDQLAALLSPVVKPDTQVPPTPLNNEQDNDMTGEQALTLEKIHKATAVTDNRVNLLQQDVDAKFAALQAQNAQILALLQKKN